MFDEYYKKVTNLIKYMANKYSAQGHFALDREELEAEGNLLFAKVWQKHSESSLESFVKVFKFSLYNHLIMIIDKHRYTNKRGHSKDEENETSFNTENYIDLSEIAETVGYEVISDIYFEEYVTATRDILKGYPDASILFEVLLDPPEEVMVMAINESRRKDHLRSLGMLVRGADQVRIKHKHIAKHLNWCVEKVGDNIKLLRYIILDRVLVTN